MRGQPRAVRGQLHVDDNCRPTLVHSTRREPDREQTYEQHQSYCCREKYQIRDVFLEKKTLSWDAKDTKKERTLLRALVFESEGRKESQSRFYRARTWSSTTRPRPTSRDSVVRIIPVVCFRRIIFAHVCMCVRIMCA